jgi:hypothetical protein
LAGTRTRVLLAAPLYTFRTIFIRNGRCTVTVGPGPGTDTGKNAVERRTPNEERAMSEERRAVHPQEPAEGAEEDVEATGVENNAGSHPTPQRPTP